MASSNDPKITEHLDRDPNDPRNYDGSAISVSDLNDPVQNGDTTNPRSEHFKGETKMSPPAGDDGLGHTEDKTDK